MVTINGVSFDKELERRPELKKEDVKKLREWCNLQQHLPKIVDGDLALFLHTNYYDIKAAKKNIENYYTMRALLPNFFENRDPTSEAFKHISEVMSVIPLEGQTKEGYKVILARLIDTDPNKYVYDDAIKYLNMILDVCIYEEGTSNGYVLIFYIDGISIKHWIGLSQIGLKTFFQYSQKGAPIKSKGLHYVNTTSVIDKIQNFVKSRIVNNKFVDDLYFHSNLESLSKVIPLDILPNEMGGSAGVLNELRRTHIKKLASYHQWFKNIENFHKVGTLLLREKRLTINDVFGPEGNFKRLKFH